MFVKSDCRHVVASDRENARGPTGHGEQNVEATHLIINQLRARARGAGTLQGLIISPAAIRCLLRDWSTAEKAGVRFHSDGVLVDGTQFLLRGEVTREVDAALNWRRCASSSTTSLQSVATC